ncbi:hypothetical protein BG003_000018 [Podila horticola]|nr:hypothetical protein BG003_000018 [Podila horticola]
MSTLLLSLFDIPHIAEAITDSLSFTDLLSCILVNQTWYDDLIGVLWLDVIYYRSTTFKNKLKHYFHTPAGLVKNAHHIRALTCRDPITLQILTEVGLPSLVEINYVADWTPQYNELGHLARLIAQCPNLHALSIEGLRYKSSEEVQQMKDFVTFLEDYPSISCLYLSGERPRQGCRREHAQKFRWPGRETPLTHKWLGFERHRLIEGESRGRWDFETREFIFVPPALAVLEHNGALVLSLSSEFETIDFLETLLGRFPNLHHLRVQCYSEHPFLTIVASLLPRIMHPYLRDLELDEIDEFELDVLLSDPRVKLSPLHVHYSDRYRQNDSNGPLLLLDKYFYHQQQHHYLYSALMTIGFGHRHLKMALLLSVLSTCPNLQILTAPVVVIDGTSEPEASPPWACKGLEELTLVICLDGHKSAICRDLPENQSEEIPVRSLMSAERIAPLFMEELGLQTRLRRLDLSFSRNQDCGPSPFLKLDLEARNGLWQLSKL